MIPGTNNRKAIEISHSLLVLAKSVPAISTKTPSPMSYTLATVPVMYGEEGLDITTRRETLPPPTLPSPAFHFNKKVPMRSLSTSAEEDVHARLQQVEAQIVKKQGKT